MICNCDSLEKIVWLEEIVTKQHMEPGVCECVCGGGYSVTAMYKSRENVRPEKFALGLTLKKNISPNHKRSLHIPVTNITGYTLPPLPSHPRPSHPPPWSGEHFGTRQLK